MDVAVAYGKGKVRFVDKKASVLPSMELISRFQGKDIDEKVDATLDRLLVEFGKEILKIVPGRVSTEVDARFSFDVQGSIDKALHIIDVCSEFACFC